MRMLLKDLSPGTKYYLQARTFSDSEGAKSEWSRKFEVDTPVDTMAPQAPANPVITLSGTEGILSWSPVTTNADGSTITDLAGYKVTVKSPGTSNTYVKNVGMATNMEFSLDTNRKAFGSPRGQLYFDVVAIDSVGNESSVSTSPTVSTAPPANVTGLSSSGLQSAISLTWDALTSPLVVGYKVYMGTTAGFTLDTPVAEVKTNAHIQSTTMYSTDHYFKVVAVDAFGVVSAVPASTGPIRPTSPFALDTVAPAVPTGLTAVISNNSMKVSWNAVSDTDLRYYIVSYRPVGTTEWATTNVPHDQTSTVIPVPTGVNYNVRVRTSDIMSNMSNESSIITTTTAAINTAPATPTGLAVVAGKDDLQISWNENTEADMKNNLGTYDVTVATNSGFTTGVLQYRTGATTLSINGLSTATQYWVRVRATDSGNPALSSAYSTSVTATTSSFPTTPLSDGVAPASSPVASVTGGFGYIHASWTPIANNDTVTYEVHLGTATGFTPSASTKVGEIAGSTIIIETTGAGASLAYNTNYYVKTIAKDRDGAAAASAASSAVQIAKVASTDTTITPGQIGAATPSDVQGAKDYTDTKYSSALKGSVVEYAVNSSESTAPTTGWSSSTPTRTPGTFVWFRTVLTYGDNTTTTTSPALLTGNTGATGSTGAPAQYITLTATTQVLSSPSAGGTTNPATSVVTGTATNTTISVWEYSVNGEAFSATAPAGVTRSGNIVTITGATMTAKTITVRMTNGSTASDTITVARVFDGADGAAGTPGVKGDPGAPGAPGAAGADAYTVLLTNEAQTFAGSTTAALAGSASTAVIAYKGATQTSATIGTITGHVTGLTTAITNNGTSNATVTVTVTTALTALSGVLTIPVTVDGKTFTKAFSWSVSRQGVQGSQGIPGVPGADGQVFYTWLKYADTPTTGMSDLPDGKTYMGIAYNKTTETESSNYADYTWSLIKGADGASGKGITGTTVTYQTHSNGTTAPTGTWQTAPTTTTPGQFLWTRTVTTYTDSTTSTAYSVSAHGATGATGSAGKGVSSTSVTYQVHTNGTSAPTGTWLSTIPATSPGQFLWTRTITNYTDSTSVTAYSVAAHGTTGSQGIPGQPGADGQPTYTWIKYGTSATGAGLSDDPTGKTYIGIAYNKLTQTESSTPGDYEWSLIQGPKGDQGDQGVAGAPAKVVSLTATTQVLTSPAGGGATSPATAVVTGTAVNTTITSWTYSSNGAAFTATLPAGVTRSGNVVTITGSTVTAKTITVRMADSDGNADTLTVAKVFDGATGATGTPGAPGADGAPGAAGSDAYTVILSNEAHSFAGSTTAALAGSTTSTVIAYKGATQQSATVGTITGQVTGLTTSIASNSTTAPVITITVTTALTTRNGTLTVPVTVDGKTFTKTIAWAVAYAGATGSTGAPGANGVSVTSVTPYYQTVTKGAAAPATPTASPPPAPWGVTEPSYTANTELYRTDRVIYSNSTFSYSPVTKVASYSGLEAVTADAQVKANAAKDAAILAASADATSKADGVEQRTLSRGTDLVTNGTGYLGNNYNFSGFAYSSADAPPGSNGSFVGREGVYTLPNTDEFIPVDASKTYLLSSWAREVGPTPAPAGEGLHYTFFLPYDSAGNAVLRAHFEFFPGTTTTLAADLNPGDTTVALTDSTGWWGRTDKPSGTATHYRNFVIWNYVDAGGRAWPDETYSRNTSGRNRWADGGIDPTTHTITLSAAWTGRAVPAGTKVSNNNDVGSYIYVGWTGHKPTSEWTSKSALIGGSTKASLGNTPSSSNGTIAGAMPFPPGTAKIKIGFLSNYAASPGSNNAVGGVSFSDASAANYAANNIGESQILTNAISTRTIANNAVTATQVADNAITNTKILNNAVSELKLASNAVTEAKLASNAVSSLKLQDNAVTTSKIVNSAISDVKLATGAVTETKITDGAITTPKIVTNAITSDKITANAVIADKIATNAVTAVKISSGAVESDKVAANAIVAGKIAANAVTATTIAADAVTSDKIIANAVTTAKINAGAVTANEIGAYAVVAGKIAGGAVTAASIAANSIHGSHIKAGSITGEKMILGDTRNHSPIGLDATATVYGNTIIPSPDYEAPYGQRTNNASNVFPITGLVTSSMLAYEPVAVTIDVIFDPSTSSMPPLQVRMNIVGGGSTLIGMTSPIAENAAYHHNFDGLFHPQENMTGAQWYITIESPYLSGKDILVASPRVTRLTLALIVDGDAIVTGTLDGNKIKANSITAGEISAGAIGTVALAAEAVDATKIKANSITGDRIAANTINGDRIITNTLDANAIKTSTLTSTVITLGAGGIIKTNTGGVQITDSGIIIPAGHLDANTIKANTSFVTTINVGAGGSIQSTGYNPTGTTGFSLSSTGLTIKGANNVVDASVIKGGTITGTTVNVGTGGTLNIDSTAQVKSNNYAINSTGYRLSNIGLEINDGSIDAKTLRANSALINEIVIGETATGPGGIRSNDYVANSNGFKLSTAGLEVNKGSISAEALRLQIGRNQMHPAYADFEHDESFYAGKIANFFAIPMVSSEQAKFGSKSLKITWTGDSGSSVHLAASDSDWNVKFDPSKKQIVSMWVFIPDSYSVRMIIRYNQTNGVRGNILTPLVPTGTGWQRISYEWTPPALATGDALVGIVNGAGSLNKSMYVDAVQFEEKTGASSEPSTYFPPSTTTIDGGAIRTGSIRSSALNSRGEPYWSINMSGNAVFNRALVQEELIVGDPSSASKYASIKSVNYTAGTSGWIIDSSGKFEANDGTFRGKIMASSLEASMNIAGNGVIISGTPTGARVEQSSQGIKVFALGYNNEPYEAVSMINGKTSFSVVNQTVGVAAGISSEGDVTGQTGSFKNNLYFKGVDTVGKLSGSPVNGWMDLLARGIVPGGLSTSTTLGTATSAETRGITVRGMVYAGRRYRIRASWLGKLSSGSGVVRLRIRYTYDGSLPTTSSPAGGATPTFPAYSSSVSVGGDVETILTPSTDSQLTAILTHHGLAGATAQKEWSQIYIEDIGPKNLEFSDAEDGDVKTLYTTSWKATQSAGYSKGGGRISRKNNQIDLWYFDTVAEQAIALFGGTAMTTDNQSEVGRTMPQALNGATIHKVTLEITNAMWWDKNVRNMAFGALAGSALPAEKVVEGSKVVSNIAEGSTISVDLTASDFTNGTAQMVTIGNRNASVNGATMGSGRFQGPADASPPVLTVVYSR